MPDLLSVKNDPGMSVADDAGKPTRATKALSKRKASATITAKKGGREKTALKYGGALTSALAQSVALEPEKKTKDQLAESVLADVIDAMNAFPGVKLKKLWPLLKELGAENDGATFKRALVRELKKEAEHQPAIALSLQSRSPRSGAIKQQPPKPDATVTASPVEQRASSSPMPTIEQELRGLRAPGF